MRDVAQLIDRLEQNAKNAEGDFSRRLADFTVWYFKNLQRIPEHNLKARVTFQEDAIWILIEIIAMQREDFEKLSTGRSVFSQLLLPSGINLHAPLRRDNG